MKRQYVVWKGEKFELIAVKALLRPISGDAERLKARPWAPWADCSNPTLEDVPGNGNSNGKDESKVANFALFVESLKLLGQQYARKDTKLAQEKGQQIVELRGKFENMDGKVSAQQSGLLVEALKALNGFYAARDTKLAKEKGSRVSALLEKIRKI